jgi:hypothetical protein
LLLFWVALLSSLDGGGGGELLGWLLEPIVGRPEGRLRGTSDEQLEPFLLDQIAKEARLITCFVWATEKYTKKGLGNSWAS